MLRFFPRVSLVWLLAAAAAAYNPPVDTAGPLTVRIMEPALGSYGAGGLAELSRPGVPVTINVSLENTGGTPLRGSLRLQVIDRWRVEPAGRPISFGALTTAGACRLTREGKTTVLTPLPESGAFEVHIRWSVLPWKGPLPSRIEAVDESGRTIRRVSLATANGEVSLTCEPGVFAYRLL